jgi:hypothetical protein
MTVITLELPPTETADILNIMRRNFDPFHAKRQATRAVQRMVFGQLAAHLGAKSNLTIEVTENEWADE